MQPDAKNFVSQWEEIAPWIVSYATQKSDNADIGFLLEELQNGGHGQTADVNFKPPGCKYRINALWLWPSMF